MQGKTKGEVVSADSMIEYGRVEEWFHVFLTSAKDEGEWLASRPGRVTSREGSPSTYSIDDRWDAELV